MKTVIRVEHLTKKYGHTVVDDLSFVIKEGTVFGLLGANLKSVKKRGLINPFNFALYG